MEEILKLLYKNKDEIFSNIGKYDGIIDEPDSILIWQYLRRNPLFQDFYDTVLKSAKDDTEFNNEAGHSWAMTNLQDYRSINLNPDCKYGNGKQSLCCFDMKAILDTYSSSSNFNHLSRRLFDLKYLRSPNFTHSSELPKPLALIVNPHFSDTMIFNQVRKKLKEHRSEYYAEKPISLVPKSKTSLIDNLTIYYAYEKKSIKEPKELSSYMCELGMDIELSKKYLSPSDITRRIETFKKYSLRSPWIFLTAI